MKSKRENNAIANYVISNSMELVQTVIESNGEAAVHQLEP